MSEIFIKYLKPRCRMGIDTFERSTEYLYDCDGDSECEAEILKNGIFKYVPSTREAYKNVVNKPCTYCEKTTHIKSFKTSKFNFETDDGGDGFFQANETGKILNEYILQLKIDGISIVKDGEVLE